MFLKRIFAIAAIVCITASCRAENAEFERQVVMLTSPMHFNELKMTINANPSLLQGATGQLFLISDCSWKQQSSTISERKRRFCKSGP